jgi:tetratricopeptide (TPR) repeat protein
MAIRGRLEHLKLFMVFRSILERKMTGVLTLQSADARTGEAGSIIKRAEVVQGVPVRTASNQRRDGLVFALVEEGLISSTEEVTLREQAQQTRTPIDVMALQMGLVAPRRLQSIQQRVARQILIEPFGWNDGLFQFEDAVVQPDQNSQGIDLVDILLEAAARMVSPDAALMFVMRYAQQHVSRTEIMAQHAQRFDALFQPPNVRSLLTSPAQFEVIARHRGDRRRAAQEVAALVLSGLARFQLDAQRPGADSVAPIPEPEVRPAGGIRRVTAPANLAGAPTPDRAAEPAPAVVVTRKAVPSAAPRPDAPPPRPDAPPPPPPRPRAAVEAPGGSHSAPAARTASPEKQTPDDKIVARLREARERVATLDARTHYEVLGVPSGADVETIRTAFRNLAREFHADRFARYAIDPAELAAVQRYFIAVNRASEVLTNPQARQEYDAGLALAARGHSVASPNGGADINKIFRAEKLVREGINLIRNGVFETARERLSEAQAASPDDPLGRAGLAYAEFMIAQATGVAPRVVVNHTLDVLTEVTESLGERGREEPFYYLGRVLVLTGQVERASVALLRAIKINPHCTEAVSELRHLQRKPEKKEGLLGLRKKG